MSVVWITGLPAAGKSVFAQRMRARLADRNHCAVVLDGDEVRTALGLHAYDERAREDFYHSLAALAAMLARQGPTVLVAATAPARRHRDFARTLAPSFIEVYVATPVQECARRDPKGLYAAASQDEIADFPGVRGYEPPLAPDVFARGGEDERALAALTARLTQARTMHDGGSCDSPSRSRS